MLSLTKNIAYFFSILSVFLGCTKIVKKKTVMISPTLCVDFPCDIQVRSIIAKIPDSIKLPLNYTIMLNRYGINHKPITYGSGEIYPIRDSIFEGYFISGSSKLTAKFNGKKIVSLSNIGSDHKISKILPLSKCSILSKGTYGKWLVSEKQNRTLKVSKVLSSFEVYKPSSPFLLMKNLQKGSESKWASFFRCNFPVAFTDIRDGETVWLRTQGVHAYKLGLSSSGKNSEALLQLKKRIESSDQNSFIVALIYPVKSRAFLFNIRNPIDFLSKLYKRGFLTKSQMMRIWEELLKSGYKPADFLRIIG